MNAKARYVLIFALVLLGGTALVAIGLAAPGTAPLAGGAPTVVAYQGEVRVGGVPYTGEGYFKFAIVSSSGDTSYWSNDGTSSGGSPPSAAVPLPVSEGLFSVLLGDTTQAGMTQPLTADVFGQPDRYLRVWFSSDNITFEQLVPDTRVAAVPYALQAQQAVDADTVDGLHASELETHYQNVVVVAKSGGDYASVQAAIDSITDAAADNAYLVWVAPGLYEEQVMMKPYVHLQGAGQEATIITSDVSTGVWPPDQGTLILASETSLRDLTVENSGSGDVNAALVATPGVEGTVVADVAARALGSGVANTGFAAAGSPARVTLQQVTALAENASISNIGLTVLAGADAVLRGGTFTGRGGERARGAFVMQNGTRLEAVGVSMLAENGSDNNTAMFPYDGAEVVLRGGDFTARGGDQTNGVACQLNSALAAYDITVLAEEGATNYGMGPFDGSSMTVRGATVIARGGSNNYALDSESNVTLDAEGVIALAENGSNENYGLWNAANAQSTVRDGAFAGRGGTNACGIYNQDSGTTLDAESVTALAEDANGFNCGLRNEGGAVATLHGGSLTGRMDGGDVYGMYNAGAGSLVVADSVTVLGEGFGNMKYGLWNSDEARAQLHGGSYIARGGTEAYGIYNGGANALLEAEGVIAMAQDSNAANYGLLNQDGAAAILQGGSFTARGGHDDYGMYNDASGTTLAAESVTVLAENGSSNNYGLVNESGAVASLHGGSFTGRSGEYTRGILNAIGGSVLEADGVKVSGEDGSNANCGLLNQGGAGATLRGGAFLASGGMDAVGIYNADVDTWLEVDNATTQGEGGDYNYGLVNLDAAAARLRGGSFTGRGGLEDWGILNYGSGTTLIAQSANALAESDGVAYGLENGSYAAATLRGGTFTARGGTHARGIYNTGTATLVAEVVTALGENGSELNRGLFNVGGAAARLRGGAFTGRGGHSAFGLTNGVGSASLVAESVTALGEDGNNNNYGLYDYSSATTDVTQSVLEGTTNSVFHDDSGSVTVSNSRLVGSAVSGTVTCVAVSRGGTFNANGCP